ncbi:transposase [Shewanella sp. 10N.286.51.B2]
MSKGKRDSHEFKVEGVKQIAERGYSVYEVSDRPGLYTKKLYHWRSQ